MGFVKNLARADQFLLSCLVMTTDGEFHCILHFAFLDRQSQSGLAPCFSGSLFFTFAFLIF